MRDVTERLQDEQALRESEARYRALVENAPEGLRRGYVDRALRGSRPVFEWLHRDAQGKDVPCEVRFIRLPSSKQWLIRASVMDIGARRQADTLAYGERRVLELELIASAGLPSGVTEPLARLPVGLRAGSCGVAASLGRQIVVRDVASDPLWLELAPAMSTHGVRACCSTPIITTGDRVHGTLALYFRQMRGPNTEELDLVSRVTQLAGIAIRRKQVVTTDARGHIEYLNPVAEQLTGWEAREAQGLPIEAIITLADETTGEPVPNPVSRCLEEGRIVSLADNVVLMARDGSSVAIQDSAAPIQDRVGQTVGAVMVFHDVGQERQLHRRLAYLASHDALTGFINRRELEERLSAALAAVKAEPGRVGALLYLDLDQFKVVNDTCGHSAGDLLLRQLADVLRAQVPKSGALARLGGDEFAVLLTDCSLATATDIAEALRTAIGAFRFAWRDNALQVGVSIGIVPVDASSDTIGTLMSAADVACYVAKDLGRNRIHVYEEGDAAERAVLRDHGDGRDRQPRPRRVVHARLLAATPRGAA